MSFKAEREQNMWYVIQTVTGKEDGTDALL